MFFSIVLISIFTGTVATLRTIEHLGTQPHGFEDLGRARIVSVKGSAAAQLLEARQLTAQLVPGLDEAIATLRADGADALVFDRALFAEGVKAIPQARITILPTTLRPEFYAIAIHPTEPIVARTLDSPRWGRWRYEYLGQTDDR